MKTKFKIFFKYIAFFLIFILVFLTLYLCIKNPSLDRNWNTDQKILPEISFSWNIAFIKNIRNFDYKTTSDYSVNYYDKDYN